MAEQEFSLDSLGIYGEARKDVKRALAFGGVDQAQLEYFKEVNKISTGSPQYNTPPPPPPPPPTAIPIPAEQDQVTSEDLKTEALDDTFERLYGSPEMRGHIK